MSEEKQTETPTDEATPLAMTSATDGVEPGTPVAPSDAAASSLPPLTADRLIDIGLGALAIAADAAGRKVQQLSEQAKTIREDAPEILDTFEKRGRPLREQIIGKLREGFAPIPDEGDDATGRTAEQDINALEQRVRELEAEVSNPEPETPTAVTAEATPDVMAEPTEPTPLPSPLGEFADVTPADETPAEAATFVPNHTDDFDLSDSPYAVSETETEAEKEEEAETDNSGYGTE